MSTTQTYTVTGMSCGHCESAVRSEVSQIPGVDHIEVSASTGRLAVTTEAPVEDAAVITAVDEAGYQAVRT
ncbi:heavy-metal-associated domain-containing protein [Aeromicrobium sp. CTD01-1L150]|uniref:heavy-metal-associated domain-containing protein n=1 Tax=Aeromicrobium sp. CTD01-1L150 TaxID=3341830 RepID=UPI0035BF256E